MSDGAPDVLQLGALSLDAGETPPPSFGGPDDIGSLEPVPPPLFTPAGPSEEEQGSEREIEALVQQGDEAQARGDRHQAIEIWSRVFLIDINNGEAVTRIEKARQEMAEETRRLAEYLKSGRESFEAGDRDAARQAFLQVLALDPEEPTARFYLEKIQEGESAAPASAPAAAPAAVKTAGPARAAVQATPSPSAAIGVPPSRGRLSLLDPKVLGVVGAFLVMTVVGVYFVLSSGG